MTPIDRLHFLLVTSFGLGLSPVAPGTVGTFGGVALAVLVQAVAAGAGSPRGVTIAAWLLLAAVLFAYGCTTTGFVARAFGKDDPGAFVLDEVVGYLVTVAVFALLAGRLPDPLGHAAAFFAFRAFDVLKIQPARKLEDLHGAFGIMADDQVAGAYAGISIWLLLPLLGW